MTLARFDLFTNWVGSEMRQRPDGDWVKFDDIESLLVEVEKLRAQVKDYQRDSEPL